MKKFKRTKTEFLQGINTHLHNSNKTRTSANKYLMYRMWNMLKTWPWIFIFRNISIITKSFFLYFFFFFKINYLRNEKRCCESIPNKCRNQMTFSRFPLMFIHKYYLKKFIKLSLLFCCFNPPRILKNPSKNEHTYSSVSALKIWCQAINRST